LQDLEKEEPPAYMISVSAAEIRKVSAFPTIFDLFGRISAYIWDYSFGWFILSPLAPVPVYLRLLLLVYYWLLLLLGTTVLLHTNHY